tara:strand:- start:223 stop:531 length:309 start_codon:yes stop_codon:yes gene_type:complete
MSKFKRYLREALIREAPLMKPDSKMPGGGHREPLPGPSGLTPTTNWDDMVADCLNGGDCTNPCEPGTECHKQWVIDTSGGTDDTLTPMEFPDIVAPRPWDEF